jgi:hypothetical protein
MVYVWQSIYALTEQVGVVVTSEPRIREVVVSDAFSPEREFSWFSSAPPANARIRLGRFLSNHIDHSTLYSQATIFLHSDRTGSEAHPAS